jgi:hypothetical protein
MLSNETGTSGTSMRAALLSFAMLMAIVFCGLGVYAVDAGDQVAIDGYGVSAR